MFYIFVVGLVGLQLPRLARTIPISFQVSSIVSLVSVKLLVALGKVDMFLLIPKMTVEVVEYIFFPDIAW